MTWSRRSTSTAPRSASRWRSAKFTRNRVCGRPCCWSRRSIRGRARCGAGRPTCELPPGRPWARHPAPTCGPPRVGLARGARLVLARVAAPWAGQRWLSGRGFLYPAAGAARAGFAGREVPGPARGRDSSHRVRRHRRPGRACRDKRDRNPARRRAPAARLHGRLDRVPSSGGSWRGTDGTGGASGGSEDGLWAMTIRRRIVTELGRGRREPPPTRLRPRPSRWWPGQCPRGGNRGWSLALAHQEYHWTPRHDLERRPKVPDMQGRHTIYGCYDADRPEAGGESRESAAGSPKEPTTSQRRSSLPATR